MDYLYRAVDSGGNTIDFYLSESREKQAAKRFLRKALAFSYVSRPCVIIVDKKQPIPVAFYSSLYLHQKRLFSNQFQKFFESERIQWHIKIIIII
jgi:transposase-like protein